MGILPLNIETGRYTNTPLEDRKCPFYPTDIESEYHFVFYCKFYEDLRRDFISSIPFCMSFQLNEEANMFHELCDRSPKKFANFIGAIFNKRLDFLYRR
jgi:hypothetical protein